MLDILATILMLISLILMIISIILTDKLIDKFKEANHDLRFENEELSLQLDNAERRVVEKARKIKALEDIAIAGEQNNECAPVTQAKIKKELFTDANQDK